MKGGSNSLRITEDENGREAMYEHTFAMLKPKKDLCSYISVFCDNYCQEHKSQCKSYCYIIHHH